MAKCCRKREKERMRGENWRNIPRKKRENSWVNTPNFVSSQKRQRECDIAKGSKCTGLEGNQTPPLWGELRENWAWGSGLKQTAGSRVDFAASIGSGK